MTLDNQYNLSLLAPTNQVMTTNTTLSIFTITCTRDKNLRLIIKYATILLTFLIIYPPCHYLTIPCFVYIMRKVMSGFLLSYSCLNNSHVLVKSCDLL